jgi:tetratricopeptide (TPR) repeat protein
MTYADTLKEEGLALFERGTRSQALLKFEEAVRAYTAENNPAGQAEALNNVGVVQRLQGNREAALQALQAAEALFAEIGEHNRQAQALGNLGDLYAARRQRDEAARCYTQAAALFAQTNDPARQSQVLRALSLLAMRRGRWFAAMAHMEETIRVNPRPSLGQRLFRWLLRFVLGMSGRI